MIVRMKYRWLAFIALIEGCATAKPDVISAQQVAAFRAVVRQAEAAGAAEEPYQAAALLRSAQSDFYFAQHLPADPVRARDIARQAQAEAERALNLARAQAPTRLALHRRSDPAPAAAAAAVDEHPAPALGDDGAAPGARDLPVTQAAIR